MRRRAVVPSVVAVVLFACTACNSHPKVTATAQQPSSTPTTRSTPPATTTKIPSSNGSATAVLPARFTLNANGSLSPPLVEGPADTTILLTVASHVTHPVTLAVASRSLAIAPSGHGSARLVGLKAGRYPIRVNGIPRGALVVGVQPGP